MSTILDYTSKWLLLGLKFHISEKCISNYHSCVGKFWVNGKTQGIPQKKDNSIGL